VVGMWSRDAECRLKEMRLEPCMDHDSSLGQKVTHWAWGSSWRFAVELDVMHARCRLHLRLVAQDALSGQVTADGALY